MDYVNDGMWDCENGEDEGESGDESSDMFADCEEEDGKEICYQTLDLKLEI